VDIFHLSLGIYGLAVTVGALAATGWGVSQRRQLDESRLDLSAMNDRWVEYLKNKRE